MTKRLLALCLLTFAPCAVALPQVGSDVSAAVIKFFLGNPTRADRVNPDQRLALDLLADLLTTQGQRQQQLNVATAGRTQITLNTPGGGQAQLVRDETGRVFLLVGGVIYPIATELVKQALGAGTTSCSSPPPPTASVDLGKIKDAWSWGLEGIRGLFAFKWYRDVEGNGADFEDFHEIGNAFYDTEDFRIAVVNKAKKGATWEIETIDERSGESKLASRGSHDPGDGKVALAFLNVTAGALPPGNYVVYAKLYKPQGEGSYSRVYMRLTVAKGCVPGGN